MQGQTGKCLVFLIDYHGVKQYSVLLVYSVYPLKIWGYLRYTFRFLHRRLFYEFYYNYRQPTWLRASWQINA